MKVFLSVLLLLFSKAAISDVTTADLMKSCDKKTEVWGRVDGKPTKVGEALDGYCKGYIDGHLAALKGRVCLEPGRDAHFVVSLLRKYLDRESKSKDLDAGISLSNALLSSYKCKS